MLSEKQMREIRAHLERAQNPIFYYDNDCDGMCSFVILRRFLERGKGVAIRSFPELKENYARKAVELKADYVFILDKPVISLEFVEEICKSGLPIVWIDHHDLQSEDFSKEFENFFVYNPALGKEKSYEPVTYLVYEIVKRKEDLWLAMMGCIADHFLPDFSDEFGENYSEFWGKVKEPFDAYFGTEIGNIARAVNFGLKDSITNVVRLQNFLVNCKEPSDVLGEGSGNYFFRKKFKEVKKKYDELVEKAKNSVAGNLVFFEYGGDLSISSDISNDVSYFYPRKYIVIAYKKGEITNLSLRGDGVREILARVLKKVEGSGGGHENAVGARIKTSDLGKFREVLEGEIGKS